MSSPFENPILRDLFFGDCDWPQGFPLEIITTGSGPFAETDFDEFIKEKGVKVWAPVSNSNVLVIGRNGWDSDKLDKQIDIRRGKELRVYSQEMLLIYLYWEIDPLDYDEDILNAFGEGHPALEYLIKWGFKWPETTIVPSSGGGFDEPDVGMPDTGLLAYLGYHVGKNGLDPSERHQLLEDIFLDSLPHMASDSYMNEWGVPRSGTRLKKLADCIASFARNAKRRRNLSKRAIDQWENDLEWLKIKFYHGRFTFSWPSTRVY